MHPFCADKGLSEDRNIRLVLPSALGNRLDVSEHLTSGLSKF